MISIVMALVQPAQAQIASGGGSTLFRSDAAGVRIEPQFEPRPIQLGPIQADVRLTTQAVVDSNIFKTPRNETSEAYIVAMPSVRMVGSFGLHRVNFSASGDLKRYARTTRENNETFDISLGGQADLGPETRMTWRTQYAREVESRGSAGVNDVDIEAGEADIIQSAWSARTSFGRLTVATSAGIVRRSYKPLLLATGKTLDQSFRDTRTWSVGPRANFALTPATAIFVSGAATKNTSVNRALSTLRDSSSFALLGGLRTESDGLIIGEVGIGWRGQNFQNPLFKGYRGFTYDVTLDWYPTPLVSFRLQGGQDVANSGLASVGGILRRSTTLNGYYDPLRKLRLNIGIDYQRDVYREIGLVTNTYTNSLTARYLIGRQLSASSFIRLQWKDTSNRLQLGGYTSVAGGLAVTGNL